MEKHMLNFLKLLILIAIPFSISNANDLALLQEQAEKGDAKAQNNLGVAYESGEYIPADYAEAKKWYLLAAEQNLAIAQNNLGAMYFFGVGSPADYVEAKKWYQLSADQGYAPSEYALGMMYQLGNGVEKNFSEAKTYLSKACANGFEAGCKAFEFYVYDLTDNEKSVLLSLAKIQLNFEFQNTGNSNLNYLGNYVYFRDSDLYETFSSNALRAKDILTEKPKQIFTPSFLISLKIDSISLVNGGMTIRSTFNSPSDPYLPFTVEYEVSDFHRAFAPESFMNLYKGNEVMLSCSNFISFLPEFNHLKLGGCMTQEASVNLKSAVIRAGFLSVANRSIDNRKNAVVVDNSDIPTSLALLISNVLYASKVSNNFEKIDISNPQTLEKYMATLYFVGNKSFDSYKLFYENIGLKQLNNFFNIE